jgi:hypothetical protein
MSFHFDTVKSTEEQMASWTSHHRLTLFYVPIAAGSAKSDRPNVFLVFKRKKQKSLFYCKEKTSAQVCFSDAEVARALECGFFFFS